MARCLQALAQPCGEAAGFRYAPLNAACRERAGPHVRGLGEEETDNPEGLEEDVLKVAVEADDALVEVDKEEATEGGR